MPETDSDYFALLDQPARPWLDPEALRTAYRQRAAEQHPDQALGNAAAFADLNTAYQTLSDPAARIRHLLARTPGASQASGQPPVDLGDLFMKIGGETRALDQLAARIRAASSALARAALAGERAGRLQAADQLLAELAQKEAAAIEELRRLDALWPSAEIHQPLGAIQARFAFLRKWQAQLREARLQLELAGQ